MLFWFRRLGIREEGDFKFISVSREIAVVIGEGGRGVGGYIGVFLVVVRCYFFC